ncbi:MAG: DUF4145 domain-containing protein [Pseudomonadota bacterium]
MIEQKAIDNDIAGIWSDHFDASIRNESARAKVVLSACYLDELLKQLVELVLKPSDSKEDSLFDGPNAPLSTFSAKIDLASRMGLIPPETQKSLHLVRRIRNEFAHKISECDFTNEKIFAWNKQLNDLNDVATPERRASFSPGPIGDFEKSVSWLVYWIKNTIQKIPSSCPNCGSEMEHRLKLKMSNPE